MPFKRTRRTDVATGSNKWTPFITLLLPLIASACIVARWNTVPHNPLLAGIIIIPLFLAIRLLSPTKAALGSLVWSAVLCFHAAATAAPLDGRIVYQGILLLSVPTLYVFLGAWYTRRYGFQPLALALGWILVELALYPAGFRQGLLPSCYGNGIAQRAIADFLGYGFVAFVVALINAVAIMLTAQVIKLRAGGFRPAIIPTIPCLFVVNTSLPIDPFVASLHQPRAPPC